MVGDKIIGFDDIPKKEMVLKAGGLRFEISFFQKKKRGRPKKNNPLDKRYIINVQEGATCCEIAEVMNNEFEKHHLPVKAKC